jgi:hypothetical protein
MPPRLRGLHLGVRFEAVTLTATARKKTASPKMLTAIGEVAARYQIPAELTGTPTADHAR